MQPLYIATEPFDPTCGEKWARYIEWSGLAHLTEVVTLDSMLCPSVLPDIKPEYWPYIVNEDFMLNYFTDYGFLMREIAPIARRNVLCVFRNPIGDPSPPSEIGSFRFAGYDLVDKMGGVSALTNCGGFPEAFSNTELHASGLLATRARAVEVREALHRAYPEEPHADCHVWAVFRQEAT